MSIGESIEIVGVSEREKVGTTKVSIYRIEVIELRASLLFK